MKIGEKRRRLHVERGEIVVGTRGRVTLAETWHHVGTTPPADIAALGEYTCAPWDSNPEPAD